MPHPSTVSGALLRALCLLTAAGCAVPQAGSPASSPAGPTEAIRVNQVGYYPGAPKAAFVVGEAGNAFHVVAADRPDTVFSGTLGPRVAIASSSDTTRLADFSAVRTPGSYVISVPGVGRSYAFEIRPRVYDALARASIKGFYYQRASTELLPEHAGAWARPAGHPDTAVRVHPSAASPGRPAGTVIASPGGWYDAGDYNKYIVNSGITVGTLLSLVEDFPEHVATLELNIPESGDAAPDVLQETLWNVRWMLSMQDPADGGVYHKLTEPQFEGFVRPADARSPRYVVQKSTAAALDFAAVMAQASRVLRRYPSLEPGLADSTLAAALRAWHWARRNPEVLYDQELLNQRFDPDIGTGTYGDRDVRDEFVWAAVELGVTTGQDSFFTAVPLFPDDAAPLPSWAQVRTLGYHSLARHRERLPAAGRAAAERAVALLLRAADDLVARSQRSAYRTPMGGDPADYVWGSSAVAANQGIALVTAYRLSGDQRYLRHALANLDYLLGRNATGYSFVTGHGDRTPMHPHHRPSASDDVQAPVPGLLSGGPNPGRQDRADGCHYPLTEPDRAFIDHVCSYASNEIAINWNAPLAYLATAMEALQVRAGLAGPGR